MFGIAVRRLARSKGARGLWEGGGGGGGGPATYAKITSVVNTTVRFGFLASCSCQPSRATADARALTTTSDQYGVISSKGEGRG